MEGAHTRAAFWPGLVALVVATAYFIAVLAAEKQTIIIALLAGGIIVVALGACFGIFGGVSRSFAEHENGLGVGAIVALLVVAGYFHEEHFVLLLVVTVLLYSVATLGLNIQFGYAGVLNFAGASFFGIGAYTSAVLNAHTAIAASHRAADRRPVGGAGRLVAVAAGAAHTRALCRGRHHRLRAAV